MAYCETNNASEAYRRSYSVDKMKPESVNRRGFAVLQNINVKSRIAELKAMAAEKFEWTREKAFLTLKTKVLDNPLAKPSDQVAAVKVLNDMCGHNAPQKHEITGGINLVVNFVKPLDRFPD